jgi:hypothetical protein
MPAFAGAQQLGEGAEPEAAVVSVLAVCMLVLLH